MDGVPIGIPSPEALQWAAERTVDMHRLDGRVQLRCQQCPDADPINCPQYRWARAYLAINVAEAEAQPR